MKTYESFEKPFSLAGRYVELCRSCQGRVAEPSPVLDPFTERHLHCIWFDSRLRPQELRTERGEEVQILHPGRWNQESGPDFLDAEWRVGGRRVRGDVEIHIRPMDWRLHGHQEDPRYGRVGLHVCYEPGELAEGLLPAGCEEVSLKESLDRRSHFFFDQIDVHAYPWQREASPTGLRAFFEGKSEEECGRMLEAAGQERLRRKALRFAQVMRSVGSEQALYLSLLRGLGYKGNAESGESLARALPVARLKSLAAGSEEKAYALLLGVAGLLPPEPDLPGLPGWVRVRQLWDLWWPHQHHFSTRMMETQSWQLDHCRPGNHPLRRLRAAAHWVTAMDSLESGFGCEEGWAEKQWVRHCLQQLRVASPEARADQLVGPMRAGALFLNTLLPWRLCAQDSVPEDALWQFLPDEAFNAKSRHTAAMLFGPDQHPRLYRGGLRKQGLLQFHEDFQL